ncbi:MAG TPA: ABC transporter permease [Thermoanaerobaculia bacterium]|jgi:putative ABC transport system permease protein
MSFANLVSDVRHTGRIARRNPGFVATILIALAVGLGGSSVILSVAEVILFRPLALPRVGELVLIVASNPAKGVPRISSSPAAFADYRRDARSFQAIAAYRRESLTLREGEPQRLSAARVSADFFRAAGVQPDLGGGLAADGSPEGPHTAVLSHAFWQRRFGGDPAIVGKAIHLDSDVYTVVGVMPPAFEFPTEVDLWYPLVLTPEQRADRDGHYLSLLARLRPGVPPQRAQREMDLISSRLAGQYPASDGGWSAQVMSLEREVTEPLRPAVLVLTVAGVLLLLVVCGNFANLLLARASGRRGEVACRAALGESTGRLVRQLLTESVVLSLAGGALGLGLAPLATRAMARLSLDLAPRWKELAIDWRVAAVTLSLALASGLVAGLAPVFQLRRVNLRAQLSESGRGTSIGWRRNRLTGLLVVVQVAFSFVLLAGAGLLIRSFYGLMRVDPGFDSRQVVTLSMARPRDESPARRVAFFAAAVERLRALPGVERAGASSGLPLGGTSNFTAFRIPGRPATDKDAAPFYAVTPEYLETMRIPLKSGRYFAEGDRAGAPPATLVSEEMAKRFFPGENPVGRELLIGGPEQLTSTRIVGVVGNVRDKALDFEGGPVIYSLHDQTPLAAMSLCVRTRAQPVPLIPAIRRAIHEVDANQPLDSVATMDQLVLDSVADRRLALLVLGVFGIVALVLAVTGVYGLLVSTVSSATREIGLRVAFGAEPRHILRLVLTYAALVLGPGLLLGLGASLAATRLLSAQLFGISNADPATYLAVAVLLIALALLACQAPARRAARVDPRWR